MLKFLKKIIGYRKFRKRAKKKKTINFKVRDPAVFLKRLEENGIEYAVLRWPGETQEILSGKGAVGADIDILVKVQTWREIFNVAYDLIAKRKSVKFDVYAHNGARGLLYHGFPYSPTHITDEILENRVRDKYPFFYLEGLTYLKTLVYHLVYHKGVASGIPFDENNFMSGDPSRNYAEMLEQEAYRNAVKLPNPLTIKNLVLWLERYDFDMPYDLLIRYPIDRDPYLQKIREWKRQSFELLQYDQYMYVFMLRDGIEGTDQEEKVVNLIESDFSVIEKIRVPKNRRENLKKALRGGNWTDKYVSRETWPFLFVIVSDPEPQKILTVDKAYPLIDNQNFYKKISFRQKIEEISHSKSNCIHGTDNLDETSYVLNVLKEHGLYE